MKKNSNKWGTAAIGTITAKCVCILTAETAYSDLLPITESLARCLPI